MVKRWLLIAVGIAERRLLPSRPDRQWLKRAQIPLLHSGTDIHDIESLQRGARNFMNYCSGCHSLNYLRYKRMAEDLKIPEADTEGPI